MKFTVKVTKANIIIDGEIHPDVVRLLAWTLIYALIALGLLALPDVQVAGPLLPR